MAIESAWPALPLTDERNRPVGWACLHRPPWTSSEADWIVRLAHTHRFIGMTSHQRFPLGFDAVALCEGWCHCFREPDAFLPAYPPRTLLPYSDFTDWMLVAPERFPDAGLGSFDFMVVCPNEPWYEECKNWPLATRCIPRLCNDLGLSGIVVGQAGYTDPDCGARLRTCGPLPWPVLMSTLRRTRILLVTSVDDASPRLLAEALSLDCAILVNEAILGGWHYVTPFTGAYFANEHDVVQQAERLLRRSTSPRAWFRAHHGPHLAGRALHRLVRALDPSLPDIRELRQSRRRGDHS